MSARQNKKQRKGRNNANTRERTVTTLTGDPDTPYLVPPTEEAAVGGHSIPSQFTGASVGNQIQNSSMSQPYPMTGSFNGFGFNGSSFGPGVSNIHQQQPQPFFPSQPLTATMPPHQPQQAQKLPLPPGKNDLEILQNLKKIILENQHPVFKAVPQPAALAALYKGPLTAASQPPTESQSTEQSSSGTPQASVEISTAAQPVLASSDTTSSDSAQNNDEEPPQEAQPREKSPIPADQQAPMLDRLENSSGSNVEPSLAPPTPTEPPELAPTTGPEPRLAEPPASENAAREKYDPHSSALWESVKTEPSDDPMESRSPLYSGKGDTQQTGSWKPSGPYSESGPPDLERKPVPPTALDARPARGQSYNARGSVWHDRGRRQSYDRLHDNRHNFQPRRQPSNAEAFHYNSPNGRRGQADDFNPRRPSGDARRTNAFSHARRSSQPDTPNDDARPLDDLRPPASRLPLISRIETDEAAALGVNPSSSTAVMEPPSTVPIPSTGLVSSTVPDSRNHSPSQDRFNNASRQPASDVNSLPPDNQAPHQRNFQHHKKRFNRNQQGGGPNHAQHYPAGGQRYEQHQRPPGYGRPPSPQGPPHSGNSFHGRSTSVEGRGPRVPPSPSRGGRDYRGPPGRAVSRDRAPNTYRPDYDSDAPPRYGDSRPPYNRDYSPAAGDRGRPGAYSPPPPSSANGRDWNFGNYPPNSNRREWNGAEDDTYKPRGNWDNAPAGERERYERDYAQRPPGWEARTDREYPAREVYPAGPPPALDERYTERSRPPPQAGFQPNYNRRQRSASPPRRSGPGIVDERPPMKRQREDYLPGDFYPPPPVSGGRDGGRRPNDYAPPPRTASPGPPSGSGSSWPPPSSTSSAGPPGVGPSSDRDYRMGGYPPPPPASGGYDRARSPGPPTRGNYNRGGGYGGNRGGYAPRT